jgi:hypothetical protein
VAGAVDADHERFHWRADLGLNVTSGNRGRASALTHVKALFSRRQQGAALCDPAPAACGSMMALDGRVPVRDEPQDTPILPGLPGKHGRAGPRVRREAFEEGGQAMDHEVPRFLVARVDRHGELPTTYLRRFTLVGRNGLREVAFGPAGAAHLFERRAEAEDVARKLRRRVSGMECDYRVEDAVSEPSPQLAAFHWQ